MARTGPQINKVMALSYQLLHGATMRPYLSQVAQLRIRVFRDWPYLYDGDEASEHDYLSHYADEPDALIVVVWDGIRMVGASTAMPMAQADAEFRVAFSESRQQEAFYFGESVLLDEYRGRGIGHLFFDLRETAARRYGAVFSTFCAVIRDPDDPRRPAAARDLGPFWRARGYEPQEDRIAHFPWKEPHTEDEIDHQLMYWTKTL